MNNKYILYFFFALSIILVIALYTIEIPVPTKKVTEEYKIEAK